MAKARKPAKRAGNHRPASRIDSSTKAILLAPWLSQLRRFSGVDGYRGASGRVTLAVAHQGSHRPLRARMRAYGSLADRFATPERSPRLSVRVPWACG
jgi:hypothetical protein